MQDLKIAKVELPERFPPDIAIFQIYLHEYHDRLHTVVQNLIDNDEMDPSEIMKVSHASGGLGIIDYHCAVLSGPLIMVVRGVHE